MEKQTNRRTFLTNSIKCAGLVAAGGASAAAINAALPSCSEAATGAHPWPWPYAKLDVEAGRKLAHEAYWSGKGCSYGGFYPIVHLLEQKIGAPFNLMPSEIMIYGHGGGVGWGGLCGALNGAAAAICLVTDKKTSDKLISDLFGWYTQTLLPTDISNTYAEAGEFKIKKFSGKLPQSTSHSILCHASASIWCNVSGYTIPDIERKERCSRVTADTAAQAITLLNQNLDKTFKPAFAMDAETKACNECHGKKGDKADVLSKMNCRQCHGDPHKQ